MFRTQVTISNGNANKAVASNYTVIVGFDVASKISAGKVLSGGRDVRAVWYNSSSSANQELDRVLDIMNGSLRFMTRQVIPASGSDANYYVYYGNPNAGSPPEKPGNVFAMYDDFNDNTLDTSLWSKDSPAPTMIDTYEVNSTAEQSGSMTNTARNTFLKSIQEFQDFELSADYNQRYGSGSAYWEDTWCGILLRITTYSKETVDDQLNFNGVAYQARISKSVGSVALCLYNNVDPPTIIQDSAQTINRGTTYNIKIRTAGDSFAILWNNSTIITKSDSSIAGGGIFALRTRVGDGRGTSTFNNAWDNLCVRRYISPEPAASLGAEEVPVTLKTLDYLPKEPSEGETVTVTANFNNPSSLRVSMNVSFRLGGNFSNSKLLKDEPVTLDPSSSMNVSTDWTALGGNQIIWVAISGTAVKSMLIKVNWLPVLDLIRAQAATQNKIFGLALYANDTDGDDLSWASDKARFTPSPTSNRTAELSFLPSNDDVGFISVKITVVDTHGATDSNFVNITVENANDPPSLSAIPSLTAVEDEEFRYTANASDPDLKWGDMLAFKDDTALFDIDATTGEIFFTPTQEQVGKNNVKITVTDIGGAPASRTFTLTVTNVNDPPALDPMPDQVTLQGRLFRFQVNATDPDQKFDPGEKLRFSEDSDFFNIENNTGVISFTPSNDDVGVYRANITVTDKGELSDTAPIRITVMNANDPPVIQIIPALTAMEDAQFLYQVNATDPDTKWVAEELTFSDNTDLFAIDPRSGIISFVPKGTQIGARRITITVKDGHNANASISFDLTVSHVNHAPSNVKINSPENGARLKEMANVWFDGSAKDVDAGDMLVFSWLDNGNLVGTGRNISAKLKPGNHTITLEVSDGIDLTRAQLSVEVVKSQPASVGSQWMPIGIAAVVAGVGIAIAIVLMRRNKGSG